MRLEEKQAFIAAGNQLLTRKDLPIDAKSVLLKLVAGWAADLNKTPEVQAKREKLNIKQITNELDGISLPEAKERIAKISLLTSEVMRSGMKLFNTNAEREHFPKKHQEQVDEHLMILEKVYDVGIDSTADTAEKPRGEG